MEPAEIGKLVRDARELKGWSQETLAEIAGQIGQSTVTRIENGDFKRMPSALPDICAALGISLPGQVPQSTPVDPSPLGARDLPIHASTEGGAGEVIVSTDPVDYQPRPAMLQYVKGAYGLLITGDSMFPEFRQGETALVNPNLPVVPAANYIFYAEQEGEARATIKELKKVAADKWLVAQHNPHREFSLSKKEWRWAHRVLGKYSRQ